MSVLTEANELLDKHYKVQIDLNGLSEIMQELATLDDCNVSELFRLIGETQQWSRYLQSASALVLYYWGFFETKYNMLGAVRDEAKNDIKNETTNSIILAKRCKIEETDPKQILEASDWILKTCKHEMNVLKKLAGELNNYSKLMIAKYFSISRKYKKAAHQSGVA